jgi:predicted amidohydrolase
MLELFLSNLVFSKSNILTVACINFRTSWGDKAKNLEKIEGYITAAAKRGADLIVFPELALTGYDVEEKVMMHRENAETVPGPSTTEIAVLTHFRQLVFRSSCK